MIVAGLDIGSLSSKALIMQDNTVLGWVITLTSPIPRESATATMELALRKFDLRFEDIHYIVSTGYGRLNVPFSQAAVSEVSCHAKGAVWLFPETRTVLDMGGQDCKAIRCNSEGKVINFALNDRCAAGTGRYMERLAAKLGLKLEQLGPLSFQIIEGPLPVSSFCVVFAERDVSNLIRCGKHIGDIVAGATDAIVDRITGLLEQVGIEEALCISGGIAKNIGVVQRLEKRLNVKARIPEEPQIVGALGAALFAREMFETATKIPKPN